MMSHNKTVPEAVADRDFIGRTCGCIDWEGVGLARQGIEPGTRWHDGPADFSPECEAGTDLFTELRL